MYHSWLIFWIFPIISRKFCSSTLLQHCRFSVSNNFRQNANNTNINFRLPVVDAAERLLVGDVIHEDKAHGAPVVGSRDGPVPLLPRCVLKDIYFYFYVFLLFF
jgi:hypothetical protein